jgi:hypothetical protein
MTQERPPPLLLGTVVRMGRAHWRLVGVMSSGGERDYLLLRGRDVALYPAEVVEALPVVRGPRYG